MKVLLVNPLFINPLTNNNYKSRPRSASPPLSLLYLAGYLEANGYPDTRVIDADVLRMHMRQLGEIFLKERPDIIGIGGTSLVLPALVNTAKMAKEVLPNCLVIAGGFGPSNEPEKVLRTGAVDFAVIGEGEQTLLELVKNRQDKQRSFNDISGIAFINQDGDIVITKKRDYIKDIDSLPLPAFHLLNPEFSRYPGHPPPSRKMPEVGRPIITVLASRGCPHRCSFCSLGSKAYRPRNPKKVVDEMELYKNKFGVKSIVIYDDEFVGMSPWQNKWVGEICDEIIRRNLGLTFLTQGRCSQFLELETLKKMKQAGFAWLWLGVESGSQRVLDNAIYKDITIENVHRAFALVKEAGLKSLMFMMVGFPGETPADIKLTNQLIKNIKPDNIGIKIATPYPGTELRRYLQAHNLLDNKLEKWEDYYLLETDRYVNHHTEEMTAKDIKKYFRFLIFSFGPNRSWYYIKFAFKSLATADGWKKLFKRIKIVIGNLSLYAGN